MRPWRNGPGTLLLPHRRRKGRLAFRRNAGPILLHADSLPGRKHHNATGGQRFHPHRRTARPYESLRVLPERVRGVSFTCKNYLFSFLLIVCPGGKPGNGHYLSRLRRHGAEEEGRLLRGVRPAVREPQTGAWRQLQADGERLRGYPGQGRGSLDGEHTQGGVCCGVLQKR